MAVTTVTRCAPAGASLAVIGATLAAVTATSLYADRKERIVT